VTVSSDFPADRNRKRRQQDVAGVPRSAARVKKLAEV
jgi:hypothetical protein